MRTNAPAEIFGKLRSLLNPITICFLIDCHNTRLETDISCVLKKTKINQQWKIGSENNVNQSVSVTVQSGARKLKTA
jgi:hypothetical protein